MTVDQSVKVDMLPPLFKPVLIKITDKQIKLHGYQIHTWQGKAVHYAQVWVLQPLNRDLQGQKIDADKIQGAGFTFMHMQACKKKSTRQEQNRSHRTRSQLLKQRCILTTKPDASQVSKSYLLLCCDLVASLCTVHHPPLHIALPRFRCAY